MSKSFTGDLIVDAALEAAIVTAHDHEHPSRRPPLWIIWKIVTSSDGVQELPAIDCICDSEHSVRYHLYGVFESYGVGNLLRVYVERVPANHRFASSLEHEFYTSALTSVRSIEDRRTRGYQYKHDGD